MSLVYRYQQKELKIIQRYNIGKFLWLEWKIQSKDWQGSVYVRKNCFNTTTIDISYLRFWATEISRGKEKSCSDIQVEGKNLNRLFLKGGKIKLVSDSPYGNIQLHGT